MNETIEQFLTRHNINPERLSELVNPILYHPVELNQVVNKYGIYKDTEDFMVCIDDIFGHSNIRTRETNLFDNLSEFFDELGDGYHSRSVGMLQYSNQEIIDKLSRSFIQEPIKISEIETNKYVISSNGCHRFTVLKTHMLSEFSKADFKREEIERIRQKYTIPVKLAPLDRIKTYCNYILNLTEDLWISSEYTKDYKKTGNTQIKLSNGKIIILNDNELIEYTRSVLSLSTNATEIIEIINSNCKQIPEFKKFIQTYFNEYLEKAKEVAK